MLVVKMPWTDEKCPPIKKQKTEIWPKLYGKFGRISTNNQDLLLFDQKAKSDLSLLFNDFCESDYGVL